MSQDLERTPTNAEFLRLHCAMLAAAEQATLPNQSAKYELAEERWRDRAQARSKRTCLL